jgi:hypothetical protein
MGQEAAPFVGEASLPDRGFGPAKEFLDGALLAGGWGSSCKVGNVVSIGDVFGGLSEWALGVAARWADAAVAATWRWSWGAWWEEFLAWGWSRRRRWGW